MVTVNEDVYLVKVSETCLSCMTTLLDSHWASDLSGSLAESPLGYSTVVRPP